MRQSDGRDILVLVTHRDGVGTGELLQPAPDLKLQVPFPIHTNMPNIGVLVLLSTDLRFSGLGRTVVMPRWKTRMRSAMGAAPARSADRPAQKRCSSSPSM